jgi:cell division protease FtsH
VYADASPSMLAPVEGHGPYSAAAGVNTSPETAQRIDDAVRRLVQQALARAVQLLRERRPVLDRCVRALIAQETLDEEALRVLVGAAGEGTPAQEGVTDAAAV